MGFIRSNQLDIMLFMSGVCGILAFMTLLTDFQSRRRKIILTVMELSTMLLLLFDRYSYLYRGDASRLGFYMVRISNGLVFFLELFIPHMVTQYLKDLYRTEARLRGVPFCLKICELLFVTGTALLVVSQFTGWYYTFDAQNTYRRAAAFPICYIAPALIVLLQEWSILRQRKRLSRGVAFSLTLSIALPTFFSFVQIFHYGVSLTNLTTAFMVIVFYIFALHDMDKALKKARTAELEFYKEAQRIEAAMFEQTAEALTSAIDAKDSYTHGHSARVAKISARIAREAGLPDKACDQVYFAALLHDVGKIGIRDDIINKVGELTDEEYEQIKRHTTLGDQILSSIKQSPSLRVGAHYHHERYDGTGYPDRLSGEDIPEVARIIAVADAYDAMTSGRSYRDALPEQMVRDELSEGMGRQFDPRFAEILLRILDRGGE